MVADTSCLSTLLGQALIDDNAAVANCLWVVEVMTNQQPIQWLDPSVFPVVKKFVGRLNTLLHSGDDKCRWTGICLLGVCYKQVHPHILKENGASWLSTLVSALKRPEPISVHKHVLGVFNGLMSQSCHQPDLRRDVTDVPLTRFMAQSMILLAKGSPVELQEAILHTFLELMHTVPGPMRPYVDRLTSLCTPLLSAVPDSLQQIATRCLATLPLCGKTGSTPADQWKAMADMTVASMHVELDAAFECLVEDTTYNPGASHLNLSVMESDDPVVQSSCRMRRFVGLVSLLKALMSQPFSSSVTVPVADVITTVIRVLDVDDQTATRYQSKTEHAMLMAILPNYKEAVLSLLATLLERGRMQMMPLSSPVCRLLIREFERCSQNPNQSEVARQVLLVYTLATSVMGSALQPSFLEEAVGYILPYVQQGVEDSQPIGPVASLGAIGGYKLERTGTKRRKTTNETRASGPSGPITIGCWLAAVKALESTLTLSPGSLPDNQRTQIDAWACLLLVNHQTNPWVPQWPIADNVECRLATYHVVLASLIGTAPSHAPFLHQSLRIFSNGRRDPSYEVVTYCQQAMAIMNALIHPRLPSLRPVSSGVLANNLVSPNKPTTLAAEEPSSFPVTDTTRAYRPVPPPPSLDNSHSLPLSTPEIPFAPPTINTTNTGFAAFGSSSAVLNTATPTVNSTLSGLKRMHDNSESMRENSSSKTVEVSKKVIVASPSLSEDRIINKDVKQDEAGTKSGDIWGNRPVVEEEIESPELSVATNADADASNITLTEKAPVQPAQAQWASDDDDDDEIPDIIDEAPDSDNE